MEAEKPRRGRLRMLLRDQEARSGAVESICGLALGAGCVAAFPHVRSSIPLAAAEFVALGVGTAAGGAAAAIGVMRVAKRARAFLGTRAQMANLAGALRRVESASGRLHKGSTTYS